jgi:hypothetical protein
MIMEYGKRTETSVIALSTFALTSSAVTMHGNRIKFGSDKKIWRML